LRGRAGLVLLLAAAVAVWWMLDRLEHRSDWLRVEAPRRAVAGQRLPLRVHLAPLAEPARVCVDLHWGRTRDQSRGYLAGGGSKAAGREGGTFDFEILVPPAKGLRFVTGIVYLSKTGTWRHHTLAAATEVIPVISNAVAQVETKLEPLRLQPVSEGLSGHPRPAALPRWLTALLFLAATSAAWRLGWSGQKSTPASGKRWWQIMAALLALACLWELLGLESWLGALARAMARAGDFYYPRVAIQKVVITGALAAAGAFLVFVWRVRRSRRLLLAAFAMYLLISLLDLVSLHAIDRIANLSWHGLSLVQALKLACAALTLQGVRRARRGQDETGLPQTESGGLPRAAAG
jgi:hypothetical protein